MSIGWHVQMQPIPNIGPFLEACKPKVMLYFQPGSGVPYKPDWTIGRLFYPPEQQQAELQRDPIAFGMRLADEAIASARNNGIPYWVGVNEPDVSSPEAIGRIIACENVRVRKLNSAGLKAVVFNFSVGWPREKATTRQLDTEPFAAFMAWLPRENLVGFHEYWSSAGPLAPENYDPTYPSKIWRFRHWPFPHCIVVTECGIDVTGSPADGWQNHKPAGMSIEQWAEAYAYQHRKYHDLVNTDNRFCGNVIFTVGPGYSWYSFDILPYWQHFVSLFNDQTPPDPPPGGGGEPMSVFLAPDERIPENLRFHHFENGKVMGSVVRIVAADEAWRRWGHTEPIAAGAKYWKVQSCTFLNEDVAAGNVGIYLSYVDENGAPVPGMQMWLAWPSDRLERTNWLGQFDCGPGGNGLVNVYPSGSGTVTMGGGNFLGIQEGSTQVGPYIVAAQQDGPSEVAAGFGLTNNHHVSYAVQFRRAVWGQSDGDGDDDGDDGEPPVPPTATDWARIAAALRAAADVLEEGV